LDLIREEPFQKACFRLCDCPNENQKLCWPFSTVILPYGGLADQLFYEAEATFPSLLSLLLVLMLTLSIGVAETVEPSGEGPTSVSNITSVMDVPLITLSNGVQVPQLGLGTQIQSLERDSSEAGRALLNSTSHDAVLAALQAGYSPFSALWAFCFLCLFQRIPYIFKVVTEHIFVEQILGHFVHSAFGESVRFFFRQIL